MTRLAKRVSPIGAKVLIDFPLEINNLVIDTDQGGDTAVSVDTAVFARGRSSSLKIVSGSGGPPPASRIDFPVTFRTEGTNTLLLRIHVPSGQSLGVVQLLISTTSNFAANTWMSFNLDDWSAGGSLLPDTIDGWHVYQIDLNNPDGGGLAPGPNHQFVRFRIAVSPASGTLYVDQLVAIKNSKPIVCPIFDDSSETQYTRARTHINTENIPFTLAHIPSLYDSANNLTTAQALELIQDGHDLIPHWIIGWGTGPSPAAGWIDDAVNQVNIINGLVTNNPSTWGALTDQIHTEHCVLPGGQGYRGAYETILSSNGFVSARTTSGPLTSVSNKVAFGGLQEPFGYRSYESVDSTAATLNTYITNRIADGADFIPIHFHVVIDSVATPSTQNEIKESEFQTAMQNLDTMRTNGDIVLATIPQAIASIEESAEVSDPVLYSSDRMEMLLDGGPSGGNLWKYKADESINVLNGTGYFNDSVKAGVKDGDMILILGNNGFSFSEVSVSGSTYSIGSNLVSS
ncbi:MAG: hypothetical protein OEX12_01015 [Gammaproteobacteria bacterium]|nr:hypothetical protein [Gammaproteobacteria bacterium]